MNVSYHDDDDDDESVYPFNIVAELDYRALLNHPSNRMTRPPPSDCVYARNKYYYYLFGYSPSPLVYNKTKKISVL